ncbi:hypothetical protein C0992_006375 [Termitomyces sp. T32_za158]|nr:hypothetical protein C0992_006375 [Termitomyces sp. T32_za158]
MGPRHVKPKPALNFMGAYAKLSINYGFILHAEEAERLLAVLEVMEEENIQVWLKGKAQKELGHFHFLCVKAEFCDRGRPDQWNMQLAFTFIGEAGNPMDFTRRLTVKGKQDGPGFLPVPEPKNEEFMNTTKEGIKKLLSTKLFQAAEISDVVPQWIATLDVG